jgi:DNA-binding transcriptional regulator YhcF (GntR family)
MVALRSCNCASTVCTHYHAVLVQFPSGMGDPLDLRVDRSGRAPLGAQLTERIRGAVRDRQLRPGDRLPSVRELAEAAGVNVNTARAVYARLESEGIVRSEHGRGTFVAARRRDGEAATRRELRRQIAQLEAALVRLPPPPEGTEPGEPARAALLSVEDLEAVRDRLLQRLEQLESERAVVLRSLEELEAEQPAYEQLVPARHSTPSLAGARIRWVGA